MSDSLHGQSDSGTCFKSDCAQPLAAGHSTLCGPHASSARELVATLFDAEPIRKAAKISDDGLYRYELARIWDHSTPSVLFIGMNPSTADAEQDDPTIRRCIRFARDWGYGGLLMGNLFAYRATDPKLLPGIDAIGTESFVNPVGEFDCWEQGVRWNLNDRSLHRMADRAGFIVAAWGAIKMPFGLEGRADTVLRRLQQDGHAIHALALTKDGHPRHPLYVRADAHPAPLPRAERP